MSRKNVLARSSVALRINGKVYPDGSCGWSSQRVSKYTPVNGSDLIDSPSEDEAFDRRFARSHGCEELAIAKGIPSPLGSSDVAKSPRQSQKRVQRGAKGLSSHGKRMVRNSAEYLEWRFGRKHIAFGTVTLPGITPAENRLVTEEWSRIIKTFNKSIGRMLHAADLPSWIVGAYEVQTLRRAASGIACLHYHFIFVGRPPSGHWAITPKKIRDAWRSALVSRVPSLADYDYTATENVVGVRKSVGAYLSKYISKGCDHMGNMAGDGIRSHPSSWYSCSHKLRRIVLRSVRMGRHVGEFLSTLDSRFFAFRKPIELTDSSDHGFIVGWYGKLLPDWSLDLPVPNYSCNEEYDSTVRRFRFPRRYHDGFGYIALGRPGR